MVYDNWPCPLPIVLFLSLFPPSSLFFRNPVFWIFDPAVCRMDLFWFTRSLLYFHEPSVLLVKRQIWTLNIAHRIDWPQDTFLWPLYRCSLYLYIVINENKLRLRLRLSVCLTRHQEVASNLNWMNLRALLSCQNPSPVFWFLFSQVFLVYLNLVTFFSSQKVSNSFFILLLRRRRPPPLSFFASNSLLCTES